jgi:hypothetical protein
MAYHRKGVEPPKLLELVMTMSKVNPRLGDITELEYHTKATLKNHKIQNGQVFARPDLVRLYFKDDAVHAVVIATKQDDGLYTVQGFYSETQKICGKCDKRDYCQFIESQLSHILGRPDDSYLGNEVKDGNNNP